MQLSLDMHTHVSMHPGQPHRKGYNHNPKLRVGFDL